MMFRNRNFRVLTWIYLASTARLRLYIMYIGLLGHLYTSDGTLPTNIIRIALCSIKRRPLDDKYWIYWIILWPPCVADTDIIFSSCGFFFCFFFLSFSFFFSRLFSAVAKWMSAILAHMVWPECEFRMQVWDVLHAARWKCRTHKKRKYRHLGTIAQLCRAMSLHLRHVSKIGKTCNISSRCLQNMVNFCPMAEICWRVWGTPANFNGFCILAALLHGTLAVDVSQTLRRWTEGATYIRQGGHHVGHWPTF